MKTRFWIIALQMFAALNALSFAVAVAAPSDILVDKSAKSFSQLVVTPRAISFGKVVSETNYFMLENSGNSPLTISSISVFPSNAFSILNTPSDGSVVGAKMFAPVLVSFRPPVAGTFTATVTVVTDASKGKQTASVTLKGVAPTNFVYPTPTATATPTTTPTATQTGTPTPMATATATQTPVPTPTAISRAPVISSLNPGSAVVGASNFILDLTGLKFAPSATVNWNGTARPTTFVSDTELTASISGADVSNIGTQFVTVSSPEFGTSDPATFLVGTQGGPGYAELVINQPANDLVYDPLRQVIYLSVPAAALTEGNTISVLDLATGAITASQFAGSDPNILAISDDQQYLYAGLDGQSAIERFILPALTMDVGINLGRDPSSEIPYSALDLQVAPGQPHTLAVALGEPEGGELSYGAVIYDDSTARPVALNSIQYALDSLQWGSNPGALYGADNESDGYDFYTMSVDSNGVTLDKDYKFIFSDFDSRIHFDRGTGLIYSDAGDVVDPSSGTRIANFPTNGPMVPDSTINEALFLNALPTVVLPKTPTILQIYDLTQYTLINSLTLPDVTTQQLRVIRWGSNGIVFNTMGGPTYLIAGTLIH